MGFRDDSSIHLELSPADKGHSHDVILPTNILRIPFNATVPPTTSINPMYLPRVSTSPIQLIQPEGRLRWDISSLLWDVDDSLSTQLVLMIQSKGGNKPEGDPLTTSAEAPVAEQRFYSQDVDQEALRPKLSVAFARSPPTPSPTELSTILGTSNSTAEMENNTTLYGDIVM